MNLEEMIDYEYLLNELHHCLRTIQSYEHNYQVEQEPEYKKVYKEMVNIYAVRKVELERKLNDYHNM